jgi:hypothetical protein
MADGEQLVLLDRAGAELGTVIVTTDDGSLVLGDFSPAPSFAAHAELFRAHEQAANDMLLLEVSALEEEIQSREFSVARRDEPGMTMPIADLQIMGTGISFRWIGVTAASRARSGS